MTLTSGSKLGPYQIVAPLGASGMGEVYRARDTRLEREAKAVSKLSHPHICTLPLDLAMLAGNLHGTVAKRRHSCWRFQIELDSGAGNRT